MRETAESFDHLWSWLVDLQRSSRADSPLAIHSLSGDRDGWGSGSATAIRARPFGRAFLQRVDRELPLVIREALNSLRPDGQEDATLRLLHRSQWRIVAGVLRDGLTDTEACRVKLGMSEWHFRLAGEGGIRALRSALNRA